MFFGINDKVMFTAEGESHSEEVEVNGFRSSAGGIHYSVRNKSGSIFKAKEFELMIPEKRSMSSRKK